MPKLFPDSTRLGKATRPTMPNIVNPSKPINDSAYETVTATGGTRTYSYRSTTTGNTSTTAGIAYNANAATIQAAIDALASMVADGATVTVGQSVETGLVNQVSQTIYRNTFDFVGINNETAGKLSVDPASLTGGTSTITQGVSAAGIIASENTNDAFVSAGFDRPTDLASDNNRITRKPVDIGQPGRIPGER